MHFYLFIYCRQIWHLLFHIVGCYIIFVKNRPLLFHLWLFIFQKDRTDSNLFLKMETIISSYKMQVFKYFPSKFVSYCVMMLCIMTAPTWKHKFKVNMKKLTIHSITTWIKTKPCMNEFTNIYISYLQLSGWSVMFFSQKLIWELHC